MVALLSSDPPPYRHTHTHTLLPLPLPSCLSAGAQQPHTDPFICTFLLVSSAGPPGRPAGSSSPGATQGPRTKESPISHNSHTNRHTTGSIKSRKAAAAAAAALGEAGDEGGVRGGGGGVVGGEGRMRAGPRSTTPLPPPHRACVNPAAHKRRIFVLAWRQ